MTNRRTGENKRQEHKNYLAITSGLKSLKS